MSLLRNLIPFLLLLVITAFITACSGEKKLPSVTQVTPPPRPSIRPATSLTLPDPEERLKSAIKAYRDGNGTASLFISRQLTEQYPDTEWYHRALFVTEQALILLDRDPDADAAMLRVQAEYPELADYAVFQLAEYHFSKSRYSRAAAFFQQVVERYPKSLLVPRAGLRRGQSLLRSYAFFPAIDVFEKFLQDYPRSEFAPDAALGLAQALTAEAQLEKSIQAYHEVMIRYAGSAADQEADLALAELRANGVEVAEMSPAELYERGRNLSRANQHDKAVDTFAKLLEREPDSPNRPDALFRSGIALFNLGRRGEAAVVLEKMVHDYPADQRTPEALYWIGKSYSKLGDGERAVKTLAKILDRFPDSEWADDALFLTGNIYREAADMKKALQFYGRLAQEYPDSKYADSALWWKAWSYYSAGDYKQAEPALQELVNRYPRSFLANQARYWQGRAAEKKGELSRAAAYYGRVLKKGPYTYYGYRAAERLERLEKGVAEAAADVAAETTPTCVDGSCPEDPLSSFDTDDGPPVWTDETRKILSAEPSFRKTLELMHLDLKKEAAQELWALQDKVVRKRGMRIGLSKAFFELGDYNRSLMLVLRNYERYLAGPSSGASEDLWVLAYPQGYWDSILSYSHQFGQDPYFIAAIIREESQFLPEAVSPAGARGIMQVMPSTGEWAARAIKIRGFDRSKLFDSDTGIKIGTWYISHLMKRFRGDPLLAAAAYNAGPDAVAAWVGKYGYRDERDVFVESIPFAETRGYVKKVLRNYGEYRRIYGKGSDMAPLFIQQGAAVGPVDHDRQAGIP
jgi:soluble lytic murein transglycosylase